MRNDWTTLPCGPKQKPAILLPGLSRRLRSRAHARAPPLARQRRHPSLPAPTTPPLPPSPCATAPASGKPGAHVLSSGRRRADPPLGAVGPPGAHPPTPNTLQHPPTQRVGLPTPVGPPSPFVECSSSLHAARLLVATLTTAPVSHFVH
jgi:hypothetical protein